MVLLKHLQVSMIPSKHTTSFDVVTLLFRRLFDVVALLSRRLFDVVMLLFRRLFDVGALLFRRLFDVVTLLFRRRQRCINVETTSWCLLGIYTTSSIVHCQSWTRPPSRLWHMLGIEPRLQNSNPALAAIKPLI